jgi:hypothetical protein
MRSGAAGCKIGGDTDTYSLSARDCPLLLRECEVDEQRPRLKAIIRARQEAIEPGLNRIVSCLVRHGWQSANVGRFKAPMEQLALSVAGFFIWLLLRFFARWLALQLRRDSSPYQIVAQPLHGRRGFLAGGRVLA